MSETLSLPDTQVEYREYPLVAAQPGIWIADQIALRRNSFAVAHYTELHGAIDRSALERAIRQGLAEADTVQARFFEAQDGQPMQRLPLNADPARVQAPEWFDFSARPDAEQAALALMNDDLAQDLPADGERPLYRHVMIRVGADRWFWYQRFHHLTLDGFSFEAITRRIADIYRALRHGLSPAASPFTPFGKVVEEFQQWQTSAARQRAAEFWRQHLHELPSPLSLSTESREVEPGARPLEQVLVLPESLFDEALRDDALQALQPADIVTAALAMYLARMSGETRFSVGFPFMRRMGSQALAAVGPVVNVLPLLLNVTPELSLADVCQATVAQIKQARRHQRYEAEQIKRDLGLVGGHQELYGPVINVKVYHSALSFDGQAAVTHTLAMGPVDDLEFEIGFRNGVLTLSLVANPAKYSPRTLHHHAERIGHWLQQLARQPHQPNAQLALIGEGELRQLAAWGRGADLTPPTGMVSILDAFQRQVERQPEALAVACGDERLSYRQLSERVMQLGRVLIESGIGAEDVVAIGIPRSVDTLVALFGVLASGAAYMPLDLDYPRERLALMCDDARPVMLLTHRATLTNMPDLPQVLCLDDAACLARCAAAEATPITDDERRAPLNEAHLAYMIYTSGSTGKPKGVMSTHRGLLNLFLSHQASLFGPAIEKFQARHARRLRAGHTASFSFDSSWEPLFCMMMGSELVIFDEELRRDPWALLEQTQQTPIDLLDITPSFFSQLVDCGLLKGQFPLPAFVMIGGEAATPTLWNLMQQHPEVEIHNYYGPSEYTVDTLGAPVTAADQPVIGRPLANTAVWLLDSRLQPVPIGAAGELYISGKGIARGYLRRPDLTAARFVANPFAEGEVMYRSGDLMRWSAEGQLVFIGRTDHQIKVRGFRVELGEVESALAALPDVGRAVVIAEPIGATYRLIGYCSVQNDARRASPTLQSELLGQLAQRLPDYMVPAILVVMPELPLNVNGKIDRQALPKPQETLAQSIREPATEQERLICGAMAQLLGMDRVGADDDFFALGGDSISAMGLGTALRRKGYLLRPREIFALHTPARMAQAMQPLAVDSQAARSVQQGPIDGLPILHWFAETGDMHHRFAHGVFLRVPAELQPQQLRYALEQLHTAHPALGARIRDGQLVVETAAAGELMQVNTVSGELESAAEQAFDAALDHLDPAAGAMMQAILLQRDEQSLGLVLAIHHLVVDGVSWRILLDELRQVADSAMQGQPIMLPPEETSLYEWSARLRADVERREAELPFWRQMLADDVPRLGRRALDPQTDRLASVSERRTLIDSRLTAALLGTLPQGYRAQVEEIMLCALAQACRQRFQAASLRFSLESHGRAELDDGLDLARTVGWLTAEYPLRIELHDAEHNEAVRAVKRATRAVADRGIGYGQLRYLHPRRDELAALAQRNAPEILFNYLGRFSQDEGNWAPQRSQTRFRDAFAVAQDAQQALSYGLEVNIFVEERRDGACLAINWSWLEGIFSESDITQLHSDIEQAVRALCEFAERHPDRAAATLVAAEIAQPNVDDETVRAWERECGPLAAALPLLPLQHGLLFHAQTAQQGGSYNSLTRLSLCGELDAHRLQQALDVVIRRHPQLAARFNREGEPLQLIPQESHWPLDSHRLPPLAEEQEMQALNELEQKELQRDLFNQPGAMLHALWVKHGDSERHTLFLNAHHLIVDGWSTPVVLNDLMLALREGEQALPTLRSNYADIVRRLTARDAEASRRIWRDTLQDVRPTLLFGEVQDDRVHELEMTLPPAEERRLLTLCRERGLTLNTVMQGIWALQLASYCGHQDVVFGSPVSGRFGQIEGVEEHVGLFSNTLPVRVRLQHDRSLTEQLTELQHRQIELLEHDDLGLGEIQHLAGAGTLFDTLLVVENYPDNDALLGGAGSLRCDAIRNKGYTHYPLTLLVLPGERLRLLMEYRASVPQPERFAARLMALLQQWIAQPDLPLPRWQLQIPQEQALIAAVNRTGQAVADTTLHQAIADQARRTPERIALQDAGHSLSYRDMQRQAALLAERLTSAGIQPGDIVAVALPRSVRLSLALTAIVQTGAAWLPLDTGYPDERLAYMVEDAKPRLIITESALDARFAALAPTLRFDVLDDSGREPAPRPPTGNGDYPAYVLYTSGSTGRPKGVVVNHRAIVNRLFWMQHEYALDAQDVVLQKTPCSFDVSVWEFFWPLMVGARLVMAPPEAHRDPQALTTLIDDYGVTTLHFVPSMLAIWVEALNERAPQRAAASLKRVFCSGEALSCELASRYQALVTAPLHNLYGPTEAAVDVTYQPASGEALAAVSGAGVPIGKPVWNTQLSILDAMLRPVPVGCAGDLYLRGIQLADGYLHRPGLTAQRFVADPAGNGARMYRTGDIARWLEDGSVEYLGRSDDQLKIRGQRIELGEIEQALLAQPGVAQAAVHAIELGEGATGLGGADMRQLVAWLIAQPGVTLDTGALHQALEQRLPAHMMPVSYVMTDSFPLSASGKLDRKALPRPQLSHQSGRTPESDSERLLAALFGELLGRETVYADDDFFALGGHSLLAMRLAAELRRRVPRPLSVGQIMFARSLEKMAHLLDDAQAANSAESRGVGECLQLRAGQGPALFCLHPASGFAWQYSGLSRYLPGNYPIIGLQSPRPDGAIATCEDIEQMVDRHLANLRRLQPQGPYYLLGYSLGGTLAHSMAARLQQQGEEVAFLGMLDTYPPEGQDWTGPSEEDAQKEVAQEQAEFMAEDHGDPALMAEKAAMFDSIVANYRDAVRILSQARSRRFHGTATLFVADQTLPPEMDIDAVWAPYLDGLICHHQRCEHADILSPASLETLGPLLHSLLTRQYGLV